MGLRELRHHTSEVIARVRRGETIEVTEHGTLHLGVPRARGLCGQIDGVRPTGATSHVRWPSELEWIAVSGKASRRFTMDA